MASRPLGECRSPSYNALRNRLPSPRVEHFDGEIPPSLSPLDAFAAQGRLLARQLDESKRRDRRMSRLPPSSVERSLSQVRPNYFRSKSSGERNISRQPTQRINPGPEELRFRPLSEHPRLSSVSDATSDYDYSDERDARSANGFTTQHRDTSDLEVLRTNSPREDLSLPEKARNYQPPTDALSGLALIEQEQNNSTSHLVIPQTLARPASQPSGGSKAMHLESSDDDYSSSNAGSTFSKSRKLSSSSIVSMPQSPKSSIVRSLGRSPSMSSEASNSAAYFSRPSLNFSRPLSRSSTSLSALTSVSHPEQPFTKQQGTMSRTNKPSPIIVPTYSDITPQQDDVMSPAIPYVYAKYSLPRGRNVQRDSIIFSGLQTPHFEWQEPLFENSPPPSASQPEMPGRIPSPVLTGGDPVHLHEEDTICNTTRSEQQRLAPENVNRCTLPFEADELAQPSAPKPCQQMSTTDEKDDDISLADSSSTARPQAEQAEAPTAFMSPDDHLTMGIECHEKGALKESTYHLRVAAKKNHPTAMLLYALACRHGWGMRPNQREGVQWLRRALDSVGVELREGPDSSGGLRAKELQKAYRAQFALSIYELGVSHLNGWGTEQDKSLALRCFEVASEWGDVDATAEAGFCYAEGVGCKKDLKKAARFYRMAEAKGMNMVGNSWIYKDKYMDEDEPAAPRRGRHAGKSEMKTRSKSRTRSFFHRKKGA